MPSLDIGNTRDPAPSRAACTISGLCGTLPPHRTVSRTPKFASCRRRSNFLSSRCSTSSRPGPLWLPSNGGAPRDTLHYGRPCRYSRGTPLLPSQSTLGLGQGLACALSCGLLCVSGDRPPAGPAHSGTMARAATAHARQRRLQQRCCGLRIGLEGRLGCIDSAFLSSGPQQPDNSSRHTDRPPHPPSHASHGLLTEAPWCPAFLPAAARCHVAFRSRASGAGLSRT